MNTKKMISTVLLLITAIIWGVAFVAQSKGMDHLGPLTFNAIRNIIGAVVLLPVIFLCCRNKKFDDIQEAQVYKRSTWIGGLCCGIPLCIATTVQQYGIMYTTVGKAGFITALYIIIVPIMGLFLRKKVRLIVWISAIIAIIGFYLLCVVGQFSLNIGDMLILICAVIFSVQILCVDYFAKKGDGVMIAAIEFAVTGIICGVAAGFLESFVWADMIHSWVAILYAGVLSCGVAYTLQIVGQKHIEPTIASLILSLEAVVSVIAGAIILQERMKGHELIGCVLVFLAIIMTQLPEKASKK